MAVSLFLLALNTMTYAETVNKSWETVAYSPAGVDVASRSWRRRDEQQNWDKEERYFARRHDRSLCTHAIASGIHRMAQLGGSHVQNSHADTMQPLRSMGCLDSEAAQGKEVSKWTSAQRDDLKHCPFCGTAAIEQAREADNGVGLLWRINCGNPFCNVDCKTHDCASKENAETYWQERAPRKSVGAPLQDADIDEECR